MKTRKVLVLPYDVAWQSAFEKIKGEIEEAIGDLIIGIEHVGSTSVEGMSAKPCIDIDVIITAIIKTKGHHGISLRLDYRIIDLETIGIPRTPAHERWIVSSCTKRQRQRQSAKQFLHIIVIKHYPHYSPKVEK